VNRELEFVLRDLWLVIRDSRFINRERQPLICEPFSTWLLSPNPLLLSSDHPALRHGVPEGLRTIGPTCRKHFNRKCSRDGAIRPVNSSPKRFSHLEMKLHGNPRKNKLKWPRKFPGAIC